MIITAKIQSGATAMILWLFMLILCKLPICLLNLVKSLTYSVRNSYELVTAKLEPMRLAAPRVTSIAVLTWLGAFYM